jgi:hypothetical protein
MPRIMLAAYCQAQVAINPFSGEEVSKYAVGGAVVTVDIIVVILFLIYIEILEFSQKSYVDEFKDQTIEMTDFTIRVKNLPEDIDYGGDTEDLKAYLMEHFGKIIRDGVEKRELEIKSKIKGEGENGENFTDINKTAD